MKTIILCTLLAAIALPAPAQPPPHAPATPPPPAPPPEAGWTRVEGRPQIIGKRPPRGPQTWLGVAVREVSPEVYRHLDLPEGSGLVVDFVTPDSPAARAGIEKFDILLKLDDQLLMNPDQLQKLVRAKKEGDTVRLHLLRNGKPVTVPATLGRAELPAPLEEAEVWDRWPPLPAPQPPRGGGGSVSSVSQSVVSATDGDYTFTATTRDGQRHLLVRDRAGQTVFDGPYNTEEERAKLPAELRQRVEKLKLFDRGAPRIRMRQADPL